MDNQRIAEIAGMMQSVSQGDAAPIVPDPTYHDAAQPENFERFVRRQKQEHAQAFPLSDNMLTWFVIIQGELNDWQYSLFFIVSTIKSQYSDLFHRFQNPSSGSKHPPEWRRQNQDLVYLLEQGENEGEAGFWVIDEDGAEGFCPLDDKEAFWQLEDHDAFVLTRFQRRTLKSGKG